MYLLGKVQQSAHQKEWAVGEVANRSLTVWQSRVIWSDLGFLATWKDVHHPAASLPWPGRRTETQKSHTQSQPLTTSTANVCCAVIWLYSLSRVAVGVDKQCELTCRPASYRFYVRQAERVRDGTPCFNVSSNDVCVEGQCLVSACVWFFFLQVSESKSLLSNQGLTKSRTWLSLSHVWRLI